MQKQKTNLKNRSAYQTALRLLSRRAYYSWELLFQLQTKDFSDQESDEAIEQCKNSLLLDDTTLFKYHIHEMQTLKKWGRFKIRYVLQMKHIPQDVVEQMIERFYSYDLEESMKRMLIENKNQELAHLPPLKKKQRIYTFLYNRGF
ncbi:MAG: regulatory protein RecX [Caldisericia bacterium]|nr:regulatory protein RecX [Caldisericia bacterium]MDD4614793.1 regulatory protein RecX [Caldisericia bacterium]